MFWFPEQPVESSSIIRSCLLPHTGGRETWFRVTKKGWAPTEDLSLMAEHGDLCSEEDRVVRYSLGEGMCRGWCWGVGETGGGQ